MKCDDNSYIYDPEWEEFYEDLLMEQREQM